MKLVAPLLTPTAPVVLKVRVGAKVAASQMTTTPSWSKLHTRPGASSESSFTPLQAMVRSRTKAAALDVRPTVKTVIQPCWAAHTVTGSSLPAGPPPSSVASVPSARIRITAPALRLTSDEDPPRTTHTDAAPSFASARTEPSTVE